jgi:uncharacterized protein
MSQKSINEDKEEELTWEEAVFRFLDDNPDFFLRHPDSMAKLKLSHEVGGRAVSLIERQVLVLRERSDSLQAQLHDLVDIARDNETLGNRLHRFALAMIDSTTLDDVFESAYQLMREEFKLDAVSIRFKPDSKGGDDRPEFVSGEDQRFDSVLALFHTAKPLCGGKYKASVMDYLFGEYAPEIKSSALIPLGLKRPQGLLCLGSHTSLRFRSGMGTLYLAKLGEMLTHKLVRLGIV